MPDLRAWLGEHAGNEPVYLSYFGSDDPRALGIEAVRIGDVYFDHAPGRIVLPRLDAGIYCVSATMLRRVYTQVRGPWTERYESEYQRLVEWHRNAQSLSASERRDLEGRPLDHAAWVAELTRLEQLRFGRLCHYLEHRAPDAVVANSVFIYRLAEEELARALLAPIPH